MTTPAGGPPTEQHCALFIVSGRVKAGFFGTGAHIDFSSGMELVFSPGDRYTLAAVGWGGGGGASYPGAEVE